MLTPDDFSTYLADLLCGTYDCVDRISLRGYYPIGQTSGGLLTWWNQLCPGVQLAAEHLRRMAGDLGHRVNAYADKHAIPIHYCELGTRPNMTAPKDSVRGPPTFKGCFSSSSPMRRRWSGRARPTVTAGFLRQPKSWPLVYHYHFHIVDKQWGHLTR